jgi:hypothetical protein
MMDKQRKNSFPALPIFVSMSPLSYASAGCVPLSARFCFTWQDPL